MQRTYLALAALGLGGAVLGTTLAPGLPLARAAALFESTPVEEGRAVALARSLGGSGWKLMVIEQLQAATPCWQSQGEGRVLTDLPGSGDANLCRQLLSSSGYSLRIGGEDVASRWRLRIEPSGDQLELQALNPSAITPLVVGRAPRPAVGSEELVAFELEPGWSFERRSYRGRDLNHIYLANAEPLAALQARARNGGNLLSALPAPPPPTSGRGNDRSQEPAILGRAGNGRSGSESSGGRSSLLSSRFSSRFNGRGGQAGSAGLGGSPLGGATLGGATLGSAAELPAAGEVVALQVVPYSD